MAEPELLHDAGGGRRIVRIDGEVHRPSYPFSASVHGLLKYLEQAGFEGAPRFVGVEGSGVEILTFVEGAAGGVGWDKVLTDEGLSSVATLLRRYHDVVRDYEPRKDVEWSSGSVGGGRAEDIILHGDPGPWNVVWDGDEAVAFIDWDHANPGHPIEDLAYLVAYAAPLCSDEVATSWMHHPDAPDRRHRLQVLAAAYGAPTDGLVALAADVLAKTNRTVERMAERGLEPQRSWAETGMLRQFWQRQEWILTNCGGLV